jgi:hypothetical protein
MRTALWAISVCGMLATGCAGGKRTPPAAAATPGAGARPPAATSGTKTNETLIVTPENALIGKVAMVNSAGRFVVLNFPMGKMAAVEQRLNLYRHGLKVGEVRITGPQREDNIVADLVAGEAEVGDQARSQ